MKAVIFAGGVGTRLWPLSRKESPKQFAKIIADKSTLELAVERLEETIPFKDIYISTGIDYVSRTQQMIHQIPQENIIGEPVKRDNGAAVGLMAAYLAKEDPDEPIIILWSDHLVKHNDTFMHIVETAGDLLKEEKDKIIFIGQKPRFASENLGWIETGSSKKMLNGVSFRSFTDFKYRPNEQLAREYFQSSRYCWNLGYFVTTAGFLHRLFEEHAPEIASVTNKITQVDTYDDFCERLNQHYESVPVINFDKAVLEKIDPESAYVVIDDIGWSDIGAWEALKEALSHRREDNVVKGSVELRKSSDNLVYNFEDGKLIVGIDLQDMVVINTQDVILVANKSSISQVKQFVESLEGTELEKLT